MALPYRTTGSLSPTFVPARLVSLAVKHAYAYALSARFPTVPSVPSNSSVTLWEETAPVKLPTIHGPQPGLRAKIRTSNRPRRYFNVAESLEETVWPSLRHSCRSELTRQGISRPEDRYSYVRRLLGLRSRAC